MPEPERLDAFMARANAAFYARENPYACFTTAPEISQVFGEICGLWAAAVWETMGAPELVTLAEAGPGRGTLMADSLRAVRQVAPAFGRAARVHLIEMSPRLRRLQAERVPDAIWCDDVGELPDGPLLLIANEFLDALPIRQFVRRNGEWAERYVAEGRFVEVASAPPPRCGEVVEVGEAACAFADEVARRVARGGGAALMFDYGPAEPGSGDSLQALREGRPADPLAAPGTADLTAHVDFPALAAVARGAGAAVHGPLPQGMFLARLGVFQRADRLARGRPPGEAMALIEGARRLAEPNRMGRLFKAFCIADQRLPVPPGFEAA